MKANRVAIVILSFDGANRVKRFLDSLDQYDHESFKNNIFHVFEDRSTDESTAEYHRLLDPMHNVTFTRFEVWSNMHGAARKMVAELDRNKYDWFLFFPDDLLATPYALTNVLYFLENNPLNHVSLIQVPYWNAHDLSSAGYLGEGNPMWPGPYLFNSKDDMYSQPYESWVLKVPRNPHWEHDGTGRSYVNVNGAGFACKLSTYDSVGGFPDGTWCFDESISFLVWMESDQGVVTLPGPPFVHYFSASTTLSSAKPPEHNFGSEEAWTAVMGMTKAMAHAKCREKMIERRKKIAEEMGGATYYANPR